MPNSFGVALIAIGTVMMALNLFFFRSLFAALPFVDRATRAQLRFRQQAYGVLITFFVLAYALTAWAFQRGVPGMGENLVGVLFMAGALFVGLGMRIQFRLVEALLKTMGRLVPICAECRKVRIPDPDAPDAESWQTVTLWFKDDATMTHSLCPACAARHAAAIPAVTTAG